MRGQAFVIFDSLEMAKKAIEDLQGFPILGRPMVLSFAKKRSGSLLATKHGVHSPEFSQFKADHSINKTKRLTELKPLRKKMRQQAHAVKNAGKVIKRPAPVRQGDQFKQLPPNKTLFLQSLPPDVTEDQLLDIFANFTGFQQVRLVPGRRGLAFIDYENESQAIVAKDNVVPLVIDGTEANVTYAKR